MILCFFLKKKFSHCIFQTFLLEKSFLLVCLCCNILIFIFIICSWQRIPRIAKFRTGTTGKENICTSMLIPVYSTEISLTFRDLKKQAGKNTVHQGNLFISCTKKLPKNKQIKMSKSVKILDRLSFCQISSQLLRSEIYGREQNTVFIHISSTRCFHKMYIFLKTKNQP